MTIDIQTRRRVLVVEENQRTLDVLCNLVRDSGCEVAGSAATIDKAVALAENEALDGAVLDIDMHGSPTFAICQALHERHIPFLVLTAHPESASVEHPWAARGLIAKPLDADKFRTALGSLVGATDLSGNDLLASLPAAEMASVESLLEPTLLRTGAVLESPEGVPEFVYFPGNGLISILTGARDRRIEIGLVGNDGMTGITTHLGQTAPLHEYVVQVGGSGYRIATSRLASLCAARPALRHRLLLYVRDFADQCSQAALINGRGSIEERLVRRLLMASDRLRSRHLAFTHDMLAQALAVRRPSVTLALQVLEGRGLIRAQRRAIELVDREALCTLVKGFYSPPRSPIHLN